MKDKIILSNLETIRRYLNKTQIQFSQLLGREKSYYPHIINKHMRVKLHDVIIVCDYCNIKIDRFLNEELELQLVFKNGDDKNE